MVGEVIDRPNPGPKPSQLPDSVNDLAVKLDYLSLPDEDLKSLDMFRRAANYLATAMIFLRHNALLERELTFDDVKPRLLGHSGTGFGLTLVYAHLNYLQIKTDAEIIYVVGPGHGAPAILGPLWMEGSMGTFYQRYVKTRQGLSNLVAAFSAPGGLPSHINSETPGAIHEGGELGYALAVAFGSVMDKPDLITAVVVGDGEAETGPTAGAWHACKYIDPKESGAVLPILHCNGFKIAERTIFGCMDNKELAALFSGYGYHCRVVEDYENIDLDLATSIKWAYDEIRKIQKDARSGKAQMKPRWPMIVLRTPKGATGPKMLDGEFIEGSFHSHQVPLMKAKTDKSQLADLQKWLESYKPRELFTEDGDVVDDIKRIIPKEDSKKLGQRTETYNTHKPLKVTDWRSFAVDRGTAVSPMKLSGNLLDQVLQDNPTTFRIFSPDELTSNKLDKVFEHTDRNFQWDEFSFNNGGRVIEMLSEHTLQGFLQGYTLTGRTGVFPSYESFLGIVHTMLVQYAKFQKVARETTWRANISSLNYIETSTWTRQEHNGFSHQNPSFIGAVLNLKPAAARVYLPPDANTFLSTLAHCLRSKNYVNLMVGSKHEGPVWLSTEDADKHCQAGASIFKFASTDEGLDPDVVLVGIGSELTFEVISAASILRRICPALRVRVVNVTDLMILGRSGHPHSLSQEDFVSLFTKDKPIYWNYHGYAQEIQGLLYGRPNADRFTVGSYMEESTTTTALHVVMLNCVSRYHVMQHAVVGGGKSNPKVALDQTLLLGQIRHWMSKTEQYIYEHGEDPEGAFDVPTFEGSETFSPEALNSLKEDEKQEKKTKGGQDGFFVN